MTLREQDSVLAAVSGRASGDACRVAGGGTQVSTIHLLVTLAVGITLAGRPPAQAPAQRQPIIDMHLHAYRAVGRSSSSGLW
jgi:hypothetical protein